MVEEDPQSFDRILSSMCTKPHPAAVEAAHAFLGTNPGDPATYPAVASLEDDVVAGLADIAGLSEPHGYVASGGTEGNIQAVRIARNRAEVADPNIVVPESGHFSFAKAAEICDLELRTSDIDATHRADVDAMEELIDDQTVMLASVAGSTEYGRVDPILDIAELAVDHGLHCHVDAAWGGFLLPFMDRAWNFADGPIDTMTIDPHKFGRAAIPAGGLLARDKTLLDTIAVETPYLESVDQVTLGGTRSGAGVASAAAALEALWPEGYEQQYERAQANATWLASALEERGLSVTDPTLPLVTSELSDAVFERLRKKGWRIARTSNGSLRIVCMPHVTRDRLETFLTDLDDIREAVPETVH